MSDDGTNDDLHNIETWEDDLCSHLLPYWREVFKSNYIAANYDNPKTPPYRALETKTVELIFSLCDLLKQPLPVYFLSVDIFDNFIANHISDMWNAVGKLSAKKNNFPSYWSVMSLHIKEQLLLRVLSSMQLASKMIYSPHQITCTEVSDILKQNTQYYDFDAITKSEFRVFRTLHFRLPMCSALECLELLIHQCCPPHRHSQLHTVAVEILKWCYLQNDIISKLYGENHPTSVSSCSLLTSSRILNIIGMDTLYIKVSQHTDIPISILKSYSNLILKNILS